MNKPRKTPDHPTVQERPVDPASSSQAENPQINPPAFIRCVRTINGGVEPIFDDDPRPAAAQQPEPLNNDQLLFPFGCITPRETTTQGS
jgi:hypothetical protein